jgi:eukaryotic-like serine/threonine-protein kinase
MLLNISSLFGVSASNVKNMKVRFVYLLIILFGVSSFLTGCSPISQAYQVARYKLMSPSDRYIAEGDQLASEDRFAEALLAYRQAVILDPQNAAAIEKLALMYRDEGRFRLAKRYLQQAQAIRPQDEKFQQEIDSLSVEFTNSFLRLAWQTDLGFGTPTGMYKEKEQIFVGSEDGTVASINIKNGSLTWKISIASAISSPPYADQDFVFIGLENGNLVALSKADGLVKWSFNTLGPIHAAALSTDTLVLCASSDKTLYLLEKKTGTLVWKFTTSGALRSQPFIANGIIYFGSTDGHLYAVHLQDGSSYWQSPILTQGAIESSVISLENRIFFGSGDGRVYALAADTGGEFWSYSTADAVYSTPVISDGILYMASTGQVVAALDPISGEVLWEAELPVPVSDPPAIFNDHIYLLSPDSPYLFTLDRNTGKLLWQIDTFDWTVGSPIPSEGSIYILGKDGTLLAFHE